MKEAGTSEHGRPSFSLKNQESSSFREERMSRYRLRLILVVESLYLMTFLVGRGLQ
jgi:hypothetical protein